MTDIFATAAAAAAAAVDLVATLLVSRARDEKISLGDSRARRKQEPAGSDYL